VARLADVREETASAQTLAFDVEGWPGHLAGQHVDVRLTAEDGYSTQRSYSIASTVDGERV
jgi:ferredoxin-NADP reductase